MDWDPVTLKPIVPLKKRVAAFVSEANGHGLGVRAQIRDNFVTYDIPALTKLHPQIARLARKHGLTITNLRGT